MHAMEVKHHTYLVLKNSDIEAKSISLLSALIMRSTRTGQTKARLNVIRASDKYCDIAPIGVKTL